MKRKIKITLIGLCALLFAGLVYGLLNIKPEIIADESLRVEEPVIPGMEKQIGRALKDTSVPANTESAVSSQLNGVDESSEYDINQALATNDKMLGQESFTSVQGAEQAAKAETDEPATQLEEANTIALSDEDDAKSSGTISTEQIAEVAVVLDEVEEANADSAELVGADLEQVPGNEVPSAQADQVDLTALASDDDFLDLNQPDEIPASLSNSVVSNEPSVFRDINEALSQQSSEVKTELSAGKRDVVSITSTKPSVFTLPVPKFDNDIMQGDSAISLQYRQTMAKLISINEKLQAADEENAELQTQYHLVASQNRQLAQIIRDIDVQIKALTVTN